MSEPPGTERNAKIKNVIRVSSGNFLEMYDFIVFGFFAGPIGRTFFPGHDPYASLMLSLATFGAGFLMRPVGAVVLGAYIDRYGRRAGLLLSLGLMSVGTFTIACLPDYANGADSIKPAPARIFGRSRIGRCFGLPVRNRDAGSQRILRQLAVQPASRWR